MERPVFILAQIRSGSTLLQRLLNSVDEVLIYGEHLGMLAKIAQAYFGFRQGLQRLPAFCNGNEDPGRVKANTLASLRDASSFSPHANGFSAVHLRESYAGFVKQLIHTIPQPALTYWGFKEIAYGFGDSVFELLHDCFPGAFFIFLVRHPVDQIASLQGTGWRPEDIEFTADRWLQQAKSFLKNHQENPGRTMLVRYEDLTHPDGKLPQRLFERLGLEYTDRQHEIIFGRGKVGATVNKPIYSQELRTKIRCLCLTGELKKLYP